VINEVVAHLRHFTQLYGIESLFIVGGFCREKILGHMWKVNDIDVASAYPDQALQLGGLFASEVLKTSPKFYKRTGTAAMEYQSELGSIKVEFQGNSTQQYMHSQRVRDWLHKNDIQDVPMMHNIYGRDFTINSLIYALSTNELYDPTGKAVKHMKRRMIKSLLPADMLLEYNPLGILRAIRFSLTYDFHIDVDLRVAMKENVDALPKFISQERIIKEIIRILKINAEDGLSMISKFGLGKYLLHEEMKQHINVDIKK